MSLEPFHSSSDVYNLASLGLLSYHLLAIVCGWFNSLNVLICPALPGQLLLKERNQ